MLIIKDELKMPALIALQQRINKMEMGFMMKLKKNKQTCTYWIEGDNGEKIASFSTLFETSLVLRYLKGSTMHKRESEKAIEIIREYDKKRIVE